MPSSRFCISTHPSVVRNCEASNLHLNRNLQAAAWEFCSCFPGGRPTHPPSCALASHQDAKSTPKDTKSRVQYSTGYRFKPQGPPPSVPPSRPCALFWDCTLCISLHGRRCPSHQSLPGYLGPYSICRARSPGVTAAFTPQRLPASPAQMTLRDLRGIVGPIRLP